MRKQCSLLIWVFVVACSAGGAVPNESQNSTVSQAAMEDCKDMGYASRRMDCEEEFMAQPRVNKASNQLKKLLASLQVKMQKADAEWSKGPIVDGDPKYAEALNAAQKAWELYAEKNCLLDSYSSRGGTVQPHQHWECDLKQAEARVLQLEEWDKAF